MYLAKSQQDLKVSFKEVRTKLKLSQESVAERLGTDQANISKLERGIEIPDWLVKAIQLHRLLDQAGYSLDDLILALPDPPLSVAEDGADYLPE